MAGFIIEFRDEEQYSDLMGKLHKAKKAICEAFDAMHDADESQEMNERRGMMRRSRYDGYRDDYRHGGYRHGGYRREYDDDDDEMSMRRDGRGRFA